MAMIQLTPCISHELCHFTWTLQSCSLPTHSWTNALQVHHPGSLRFHRPWAKSVILLALLKKKKERKHFAHSPPYFISISVMQLSCFSTLSSSLKPSQGHICKDLTGLVVSQITVHPYNDILISLKSPLNNTHSISFKEVPLNLIFFPWIEHEMCQIILRRRQYSWFARNRQFIYTETRRPKLQNWKCEAKKKSMWHG